MNRIQPITLPHEFITNLVNEHAEQRRLTKAWADRYDADSGDSIAEYANRAAFDVYEAGDIRPGTRRKREEIRTLVKSYIHERNREATRLAA